LLVQAEGTLDGEAVSGEVMLPAGGVQVAAGPELPFAEGAPVPHAEGLRAVDGPGWTLPMSSGHPYALYTTYSLIIALFLGTMGLPHVLVRFYTNPDGRAARRTTVTVLVMLGAIYQFP